MLCDSSINWSVCFLVNTNVCLRLMQCGLRTGKDEAEAAERHANAQEVHQQAAVLHPVLWDGVRGGPETVPGTGRSRGLQHGTSPPRRQVWWVCSLASWVSGLSDEEDHRRYFYKPSPQWAAAWGRSTAGSSSSVSSAPPGPTRTRGVSCPVSRVPVLKDRELPEPGTCLSVEVTHHAIITIILKTQIFYSSFNRTEIISLLIII